jgi:nucleosome binding factor SPN SPT16 subunit
MKDQNVCFVRELTFRSKNSKNMAEVVKKIKDLQKKIKDKQNEEKHSIWDPESDPLVLIKGKKPFLSDLKVRPNISGKKSTGNLEAHANGFRFITKKGEKLGNI